MNCLWQKFSKRKDHNKSALDKFSFQIVNLPVLLLLHGLSGRNMLNLVRHTNLCIHNSESYMFLELTLLGCIPTLVYQLIVRNSCAFVFIDAYYSCGLSSHSILEWLGETNSSTSSISWIGQSSCIPQIKMPIQLLFCSTSEYYPLYVRIAMRIAPPLMNSWRSDTSRHHYPFLGSVLL